jgi:hypothetical protein
MVRNGGDLSILEEDLRRDRIFLLHNSPTEIRATSRGSMIAAALVAALEQGRLPCQEPSASSQDQPEHRLRLFNLHRALATASKTVIVVEGYLDCVRVRQAGFPSVVALDGVVTFAGAGISLAVSL